MSKPLVFVGLSGGVDSSVAALRLLKGGYRIVGVFIKVWHPEWMVCDWEKERLDAMRVAAHLGIPFMTCDAVDAYREGVADYFISEYLAGRTPNPDVMCNQQVKFGAFLKFAIQHGADAIATGHYARVVSNSETHTLYRGTDTEKDQTYFLWTLTQKQLSQTLLPVGNSTKHVIRAEAKAAGLPTAVKKDSQGICFLGHVDIPEFLGHYTELVAGSVLDQAGNTIGEHRGALVYTLGQRHGFTIHASSAHMEPHYVTHRDLERNTITVSTHVPIREADSALSLIQINWTNNIPVVGEVFDAQVRYRQQPFKVSITEVNDSQAVLKPHSSSEVAEAGQSCVLYEADRCIGGGIIA